MKPLRPVLALIALVMSTCSHKALALPYTKLDYLTVDLTRAVYQSPYLLLTWCQTEEGSVELTLTGRDVRRYGSGHFPDGCHTKLYKVGKGRYDRVRVRVSKGFKLGVRERNLIIL